MLYKLPCVISDRGNVEKMFNNIVLPKGTNASEDAIVLKGSWGAGPSSASGPRREGYACSFQVCPQRLEFLLLLVSK